MLPPLPLLRSVSVKMAIPSAVSLSPVAWWFPSTLLRSPQKDRDSWVPSVYKEKLKTRSKTEMKHKFMLKAVGLNPTNLVLSIPAWPLVATVSSLIQRRLAKRGRTLPDVNNETRDDRVEPPPSCQFAPRLRRKARTCVRFLSRELGLKGVVKTLPSRIECGQLRPAIRRCFGDLNEIEELSIKTAQKLEKSFCRACDSKLGLIEEKWKEARFGATEVDEDHLARFADAFGRNVERGWNRGKYPYIPNGSACLGVTRREGGTWVEGELSPRFDVQAVVSAGKPRIVTSYSEGNSRVLHSLHHSLFDSLRRWGWLLVGSPTNEQVASLNGGEYISVDYSSATDRIKTAYTRAAIEVLIDKGDEMCDEELRALRIVGDLTLGGKRCLRGQPMGSKMSFPLLCLINKTVVDMSLDDLLDQGKISFKEWTSHRCLINGDDLLLRDLSPRGALLDRIERHGTCVGLMINREKTMVHATMGEINSTLFVNGVQQKKINCGALFMGRDEADVLGFAFRSCRTLSGFLFLVLRASAQLARQVVKLTVYLPITWFRGLLADTVICRALRSRPQGKTEPTNPFPVVAKPVGYDLSREEEIAFIKERVDRLRSMGYRPPKGIPADRNVVEVLVRGLKRREKPIPAAEETLLVLAQGWERKTKELLVLQEQSPVNVVPFEHVCDHCSPRGPGVKPSRVDVMICEIRELKRVTWSRDQVPGTQAGGDRCVLASAPGMSYLRL